MRGKKLSGAQNRKRRREREVQEQKAAKSRERFLQLSGPSNERGEDEEGSLCESRDSANVELESPLASTDKERKGDLSPALSYPTTSAQSDRGPLPSFLYDPADPASWPKELNSTFIDKVVTYGPPEIEDIQFPLDKNKWEMEKM